MDKPTVSIIMGVLNAENRMKDAIKSIQNQIFTDWEFIICDDGSTDSTYNVLLNLAEKDRRIKPIKNEKNLGLTRTLNRCLEIAKGKYIARMDDDDFSYVNRLEVQVNFLEENTEYDFVSSAVDVYDGEKVVYKEKRKEFPQKEDFLWNSPFVHPATMFRTLKIKEVYGYRFAQETRRAEDYDLFMRMYAEGMKGYNFQEAVLRYFVNLEAMRKRRYKYRIDEAIVRYKGFKRLGLFPKAVIYVIKPLVVGLLPNRLLFKIKQKY